MRNIFFIVFIIQFSVISFAGFERYGERPSIKSIKSDRTEEGYINGILEGMIRSVVFMAEGYSSDAHFFFLARDAEYAYDVAVLMSEIYPDLKKRIHLINISTALSFDMLLPEYLKQVGINKSFFKRKKKAIFVETGFMGTVPEMIKLNYERELWEQLGIMLFDSDSFKFPSVNFFSDYGSAGELEEYPHYTDTALSFAREKDGSLEPVSFRQSKNLKQNSVDFMATIKDFLKTDRAAEIIAETTVMIKQDKKSLSKYNDGDLFSYYGNNEKEIVNFLAIFDNKGIKKKRQLLKEYVDGHMEDWQKIAAISSPRVSSKYGADAAALVFEFIIQDEYIDFDNYETYEDLILSYLDDFIKMKDTKLAKKVYDRAIELEAEEALEKLTWAVSKRDDAEEFDKLLADMLRSINDIFDSPTIILKIVNENLFSKNLTLKRTRKVFEKVRKRTETDKLKFMMRIHEQNNTVIGGSCNGLL